MYFRVFVPGLGQVWVETQDANVAIQRAIGLAAASGVNLTPAVVGSLAAVGSSGPAGNGFLIDGAGKAYPVNNAVPAPAPVATVPPGQGGGAPQQPENGQGGEGSGGSEDGGEDAGQGDRETLKEYIVKVSDIDGYPEFVRVTARDGAEARAIVVALYPRRNVSGANTAEYFHKNDPDFRQQAGDDLDGFLERMDDVTPKKRTEAGPVYPEFPELDGELVAKLVHPNGRVEFVRVRAGSSEEARSILQAQLGQGGQVVFVTTGQYLYDNDPDFKNAFDGADKESPGNFLLSLRLVEPSGDAGGGDGGGDGGSGDSGTPGDDTGPSLPYDIQDFPYATFQNALEALGYDPDGIISGLLGQRFESLYPAFQIGSLTGTFDPIGNDPGALQNFYEGQFGNLGLAADVFRDLIAGNAASGLDSSNLLAYQAFVNPDFGSGDGRTDAGAVLDLAQAAAADRFGSFIARNLLPSNQRLLNEYERLITAAGGVPAESFLDFARRQSLLPVNF